MHFFLELTLSVSVALMSPFSPAWTYQIEFASPVFLILILICLSSLSIGFCVLFLWFQLDIVIHVFNFVFYTQAAEYAECVGACHFVQEQVVSQPQ